METQAQALDAVQTEQVEPLTQLRQWTEAPNSANVRASVDGHDWQITIRDDTFNGLSKKMIFINEWLDHHNGKKQAASVQPAPAQIPVSSIAPTSSATPVTPPQQVNGQKFTMTVERLEVTPRADGRVDAKFFQHEHKYPDMTAVKTPDDLCALLAKTGQWTPAHFAAAAQYQVKMVIDWVNSDKLNKNNKPYKNIVEIRLA